MSQATFRASERRIEGRGRTNLRAKQCGFLANAVVAFFSSTAEHALSRASEAERRRGGSRERTDSRTGKAGGQKTGVHSRRAKHEGSGETRDSCAERRPASMNKMRRRVNRFDEFEKNLLEER